MNKQDQEKHTYSQDELLSNDELGDVAAGVRNCETAAYTAFFNGLSSTAGPEGRLILARAIVHSMPS
jgi:hypothetical protein